MPDQIAQGTPDLVTPEPTQAELDTLFNQAQMIDTGDGFTTAQIKPLYPRLGWNVFTARMNALIAAGRIRKQFQNTGRGSGYDKYFVVR